MHKDDLHLYYAMKLEILVISRQRSNCTSIHTQLWYPTQKDNVFELQN